MILAGHCLHVECYDSWAASRLGSLSVKFPMCNKQTSFCLLLLDLETVQLNGNDNNVISQSVKSYDAEIFEENKEPEESHCASAKLGNEQAGALNI